MSDDPAAESELRGHGFTRLCAEFVVGDTTDRRLLDTLDIGSYDQVVTLSSDKLDAQAVDARTLVTLLHLRDLARKFRHEYLIVSEMLDVRNRELAEMARADDFIVSDRLVSLMLSQLSESRDLNLADLFDAASSTGDRTKAYGVIVNPNKARPFSYAEEDRILVLADS